MTRNTQYSAVNLIGAAGVDPERWSRLPDDAALQAAVRAIERRNIRVVLLDSADRVRDALLELIPEGAEVMNGSSTTLIECGYPALLEENPKGWRDYHAVITAENDEEKRHELRRKAVAADWFLSSAQAIAGTGEVVGCDRTGTRVGAFPSAAGHLVLVAGTNKIAPTLDDALRRCREYALPLEVQRSQRVYGVPSQIGYVVIIEQEAVRDRVTLILVREQLGY